MREEAGARARARLCGRGGRVGEPAASGLGCDGVQLRLRWCCRHVPCASRGSRPTSTRGVTLPVRGWGEHEHGYGETGTNPSRVFSSLLSVVGRELVKGRANTAPVVRQAHGPAVHSRAVRPFQRCTPALPGPAPAVSLLPCQPEDVDSCDQSACSNHLHPHTLPRRSPEPLNKLSTPSPVRHLWVSQQQSRTFHTTYSQTRSFLPHPIIAAPQLVGPHSPRFLVSQAHPGYTREQPNEGAACNLLLSPAALSKLRQNQMILHRPRLLDEQPTRTIRDQAGVFQRDSHSESSVEVVEEGDLGAGNNKRASGALGSASRGPISVPHLLLPSELLKYGCWKDELRAEILQHPMSSRVGDLGPPGGTGRVGAQRQRFAARLRGPAGPTAGAMRPIFLPLHCRMHR